MKTFKKGHCYVCLKNIENFLKQVVFKSGESYYCTSDGSLYNNGSRVGDYFLKKGYFKKKL